MQFEIDGGADHRDTFFANHVVYLGIFLVGNMDTLMATRGCPEIFTLTHAREQCCCSIFDSQNWPYHLMLKKAVG